MADVNKTILLEYDLKTGKLIDENGKVIKSLKQFVDEVKKATQAQQQMGDVIGKNSEVILGSADHIRKQIQVAKQQREATSTNNEEYLRQTMVITGLEERLQQITKTTSQVSLAQSKTSQTTKELAKLQENQARSAGLAGAAAFELGRTISDLPFGLVAVTNNISQLGTLMAALIANAGGLKQGLAALGKQLAGPAGILVAFQVVTAAITFFAQQSNKAKKEAQGLNLELETQIRILEDVIKLRRSGRADQESENALLEKFANINKNIISLSKEGVINDALKTELLEKSLGIKKLTFDFDRKDAETKEKLTKLETKRIKLDEKRSGLQHEYNILKDTESAGAEHLFNISQKIQLLTEDINAIEVEKTNIFRTQQIELTEIAEAESEINKQVQDILDKKERLLDIEKKRKTALSELVSEELSAQEALTEDAILEEDLRKFKLHFSRLLELKKLQLSEQKKEELDGVEDKTIVNAIEAKYRILFESINNEFEDKFKEGIEKIVNTKLVLERKDKVSFTDLINPPDTEAQRWAREQVNKIADATDDELGKRIESQGERNFFVDTYGISEENFTAAMDLTKQAFTSINEVFSAQAEKEIAIEQNKTNRINDELRRRLANEQLSAEQRDQIQQEISRNDAKLVEKENQINKKRFEQEKAFNIAIAVIDTYVAANMALKDKTIPSTFARIAAMVSIIGSGLANVAAISKQKFVAKALPNPNLSAQGTAAGSTGPSFNVVGTSGQNQLAAAIEGLRNDPLKAYVVSSDVTTAQELERKIVEGASI